MPGPPSVAHVPMALSVQGSTLMSVAARLSEAWSGLGGESVAVLSDNRDVSLPVARTHLVDYTRECPREWFTRREQAVDVVAGSLGRLRPHHGRMYDPAVEALLADPPGIVLLYEGHYASATLPRWRELRRRSEICLYVHNPLSRTYRRRELARLLDGADRVIFCADHLRADVESRLGRTDDRFSTVPNGVEEMFRATAPRTAPEEFTVVFAGRLAPHKGVHVLLEALAEWERRDPTARARVIVLGGSAYGGSAPDEYEQRLRALGNELRSVVEFPGWASRETIAQTFRDASAVVIPSLWDEGLPLVALEALASGTPMAHSDSAGLREATAGIGLVHRMGDAAGLADDLGRLAADGALWARLSAAGVERARGFTWTAAMRRIARWPE